MTAWSDETNVMSLSGYKLAKLIEQALDWVHAYEEGELDLAPEEQLGTLLHCGQCDSPAFIVAEFGSVCMNCGGITEQAFHCLGDEVVDGEG